MIISADDIDGIIIGVIKIRDIPSGRCVKEFGSISDPNQGELSEGVIPPGYTQLLYQLDHIIAVTVDHNILVYGLPELDVRKQVKIAQVMHSKIINCRRNKY